ncbi:hypothetical protein BD310DRAFT_421707 [Dichomitus squalens]|uniref:Uncharacterized protein n=1 Tax=Dichomitus squalens TaxID=114155 RepID=A0A4Q9PXN0_9APHY|nr:hypothetical protein BD310DRAFT_421707 [Dichomitus squalens]
MRLHIESQSLISHADRCLRMCKWQRAVSMEGPPRPRSQHPPSALKYVIYVMLVQSLTTSTGDWRNFACKGML